MISYIKNGWALSSIFLSLLVIIPIVTVTLFFIIPGDDTWIHLRNTVLNQYIKNSIILVLFVSMGTIVVGMLTAWLVTMYSFPFKKYIEWILVLPLAIPSYALAYVYSDILGYGGYITKLLAFILNSNIKSINFYSIYGAIFVFTFSLYPYVYLLTSMET